MITIHGRVIAEMLGFIIGIVVGCAQPVMTSVNGRLREHLRSPLLSSVVTFAVALLLTLAILFATQGSLYIPFSNVIKEPLWIWLGGVCGVVIVVASVLCLPKLGSFETVVFLVLGQVVSGLAIDHFGMFRSNVIPITLLRAVGAVLVLAGVVGTSTSNKEEDKESGHGKTLYRFIDLIAGIACSVQIAVNGRLGVVTENSFRSSSISMMVALVGGLLIVGVLLLVKGKPGIIDYSMPVVEGKWWMWLAGIGSTIIVGGNVILQTMMGTGLAAVLNVLGQTAGGIVIDASGFLGIEKKKVTLKKLIGLVVMIIGTALISFF